MKRLSDGEVWLTAASIYMGSNRTFINKKLNTVEGFSDFLLDEYKERFSKKAPQPDTTAPKPAERT